MLEKSVIRKLLLARRLFDLAAENLNSTNDLSLAVGVNLIQDSVEVFLLGVIEHLNIALPNTKSDFNHYLDTIDKNITPKQLPFRQKLISLNKLRVNSKHYGIVPAISEVSGITTVVREFYEEVCSDHLGISFINISLIELLKDGEAKELLKEAEQAFLSGNFQTCLFACRKAIFVSIEAPYDIAPFADIDVQAKSAIRLAVLGSKAPYYARNQEYVAKNVKEPMDYIVLTHADVDMEMVRNGIDTVSFWNVWRLTPEVYRPNRKSKWLYKYDYSKLDEDGIKEKAEYVLDTTITMLVAADQKMAAVRWTEQRKYTIKLKKMGAPLYEKAAKNSKIKGYVPQDIEVLEVRYKVDGLDGHSYFDVSHWEEESTLFLIGYLADEDVDEQT